jgi:hypothetical protein
MWEEKIVSSVTPRCQPGVGKIVSMLSRIKCYKAEILIPLVILAILHGALHTQNFVIQVL